MTSVIKKEILEKNKEPNTNISAKKVILNMLPFCTRIDFYHLST